MRHLVLFSEIQWFCVNQETTEAVYVELPTEVLSVVDTYMGDNVELYIHQNGHDFLSTLFGGWKCADFNWEVCELTHNPEVQKKMLATKNVYVNRTSMKKFFVVDKYLVGQPVHVRTIVLVKTKDLQKEDEEVYRDAWSKERK